MSNNLTSPQYPIDYTGTNPANRVSGELQPLTGAGDRDYYFVIPAATPFFAESMKTLSIRDAAGTISVLEEGVDFYLTHYFKGASLACAKSIYGSITIINRQLVGTLILPPYQCLGGDWTVDSNKIAEVLAQQAYDPRTLLWDQVAGYPNIFPPVPHEWNLVDMVGQSQLLDKLDEIVDAILTQASSAMIQHINDMSGHAHGITPATIGAVSLDQLTQAVNDAVQQATSSTDALTEGQDNLFFKEARVLLTKLKDLEIPQVAARLAATDTILLAFGKLQAQNDKLKEALAEKTDVVRPFRRGLGSQNLVKVTMTASFSLDITQSEAFQILIKGSGAIGFNTGFLGDMTDRVVEFAITTINDATNGAFAIGWPANVKWVDGTPPPRSTGANQKDYWYFVSEDGGATWTGSLSNKNPN